jgi:signal transduction histidine kinase
MDAFAAITENTLVSLADRLGIDPEGNAVERLRQQTRAALEPFVTEPPSATAADDIEVTVSETPPGETGPLPQESLVSEAVRANLAMTDLSTRLEIAGRQLERKARITKAITDFGRGIANERDPAEVLRRLLRTAVAHLGVQAAAVLIAPAAGQLREAVVHGIEADPLLAATVEGAGIAGGLAANREPILIARDLEGVTSGPVQLEVEKAGFASAIAVPLSAQDRLLGLLTVYGGLDRPALDEDELALASILGATAAMGYANALAFRQLEASNTGLKSSVTQRDGELKTSIEEIQRLNRELTELDTLKNELIAKVADQLRAPVTAITTASGALQRLRDAPAEKTARFVEMIRSKADTLSELIESISQASLFGSETGAGRLQPTSLPDLLRRTIAPLSDFARALSVEIKVLSPGALKTISCDSETLTTALRAMVKNAVEHSPAEGEVRIEVHRVRRGSEPWIELAVSDTGDGIVEADRNKAFDFFWQGEGGKRGGYGGIGIGLAIARQVAIRHGGRMVIEGREPTGARVSMLLPQPGLD